jgi:hypothetical protein
MSFFLLSWDRCLVKRLMIASWFGFLSMLNYSIQVEVLLDKDCKIQQTCNYLRLSRKGSTGFFTLAWDRNKKIRLPTENKEQNFWAARQLQRGKRQTSAASALELYSIQITFMLEKINTLLSSRKDTKTRRIWYERLRKACISDFCTLGAYDWSRKLHVGLLVVVYFKTVVNQRHLQ